MRRDDGDPVQEPVPQRAGEARLVAGTVVGPYEVRSLLGAGGMGEVYLAYDPRLAREVALKILPADRSEDRARIQRFEREARSIGAFNHPNIVSIYDVGTDGALCYIVTERLHGRTLR